MTRTAPVLADRLSAVLGGITVDLPALTAVAGDRAVTATSRAELKGKLASAVYEHFHQGAAETSAMPRYRDPGIEGPLIEAVPHATTPTPVRPISREGADAVVTVGGVRVRLSAEDLREGGTVAALPSVRPNLSPGFLLVDGSAGAPRGRIVRLYVRLADPVEGRTVWARVLERLESAGLPYRAKTLTVAESYPRNDALVVYADAEDERTAAESVCDAASVVAPGSGGSPFAAPIAPGVSVASEPDDPRQGRPRQSFGEHRAEAVVEGILAYHQGEAGSDPRASVATALTAAGCDPAAPERNLARH
ncbi:T3SS effector HopA1 family protein [Amycolatopsis sp. CA-230715]|uniref:T3SS effector HopA1 family protein n=1 Tax=Amycolatopsis sp. CA-230715 TaxID=2745196 RepID=UPI001C01EA87|nr:T3SS effector HopA1 family protein [Amycolatopsis sp. CA-230715]QWF82523.1 hypothetical protein HUW46_05961 [Amycolatopsis sp. CA-230715]